MVKHAETIAEKLGVVRAYYGSELYRAVVELCIAIEAAYDEDLRTVMPDNLRYKQGAAKQVRVLREAMLNADRAEHPKV